jgi:hypothetical protein
MTALEDHLNILRKVTGAREILKSSSLPMVGDTGFYFAGGVQSSASWTRGIGQRLLSAQSVGWRRSSFRSASAFS